MLPALPGFRDLQLHVLFPCSSRYPEPRSPQLSAAMSAEVKVTGQNQEQFLLLAKSAKGAALATLIHQVLEAPGVYVFGELLDMPNVREVGSWPGKPTLGAKFEFENGGAGLIFNSIPIQLNKSKMMIN